jgi:hypothetical protein
METARLRAIVTAMKSQLLRLSSAETLEEKSTTTDDLVKAFADLVELLALGPEPETRPCPACHRVVRREATVCGFCWIKLTPPHLGINGGLPH